MAIETAKSPSFTGLDAIWPRVARGVSANLLTQLVSIGTQVSVVPVLALAWGATRYGEWLMAFTLPGYLALTDLGFATAAGTAMTMQVGSGDVAAARRTFANAVAVILPVSVASAAVLLSLIVAGAGIGLTGFSHPADDFLLTMGLLTAYGIVSILNGLLHAGFRSTQRYATVTTIYALAALAETILALGLVLLGAPMQIAAAAYLLTRLGQLGIMIESLRRTVSWLRPTIADISRDGMRELLPPSLAVVATSAGQAIILQGTTLVVGGFVSPAAAATLNAVRTLTRSGIQFANLLTLAVMPEISAMFASRNFAAVRKLVVLSIGSGLAAALPIAAILLLYGPQIIDIWTSDRLSADIALVAGLTVSMLGTVVWYQASRLVLSVNLHMGLSYVSLLLAVALVPVSMVAAQLTGVAGVAWSLAALDLVLAVIASWYARRIFFRDGLKA